MSNAMLRVARLVAPAAPKERRRPNYRDRIRVAEVARRIEAGEDEGDAAWAVFSDPKLGLTRWRGAPVSKRPSDVTLWRTLGAHIGRAAPAMAEEARDRLLVGLARLDADVLAAVREGLRDEFDDPARAGVRRDYVRLVMEGYGLIGRGGGTQVQNAVQVNVAEHSASRDDSMRIILEDPELLGEFDRLAAKVEARRREAAGGPIDLCEFDGAAEVEERRLADAAHPGESTERR